MAQIYEVWVNKNSSITATKSVEIPESRNFDEAIISIEAGGQSGTNPTLDIDVEQMHTRWGQGTEAAFWTRVQTQKMGQIADAANTNVQTIGDFSYGTFTQITSGTTFTWVEMRGLPQLIGTKLRITLRLGGTNTPTFTNVTCVVMLKAKGAEVGIPI